MKDEMDMQMEKIEKIEGKLLHQDLAVVEEDNTSPLN